ncbi:hypothetical protein [Priestia megaterium]|uniref:hypothetical protein n=2 Tax=Priestia megaterium TaxID=1404 RepID=UPI002E1AC605|nr:hypothetical protein [Priestia megaterium]
MIKQNGIILLEKDDLGVDMNEIYQRSCFYEVGLPMFEDIYDEYKIQITNKNINTQADNLKGYLSNLRSGKETDKLSQLEVEELATLSKVELHFYLNKGYYSFAAGKKDVFNLPISEVW